MKKFYLLMLMFISTSLIGQTPIFTMIMDGDCTGGNPKVVEIYAQGTVDFSNYSLENQNNANTTWGNTFDLTPLGTVTDDFVYIHKDDPAFATEFPNISSTGNTLATTSSVVGFNGDDRVRIIETASGTSIDEYGVDSQDGTGEVWEYEDGYAKRANNTGPDGTFVSGNWTYFNGGLDGLCGTTTYEVIANAGSYTLSTGPTVSTSSNNVSGFLQFVGTPSAEKMINVSGMNLTDDIVVSVSAGDYEVSTTSGASFGNSATIPFGSGTVAPTAIYIRLNGTVPANPANGELTISSLGATDETVVLEGEIALPAPTLTVSDTLITGLSHFVGVPSSADSFNVEGFNLTADINITAPTNFEISNDINSGFASNLTVQQSGGSVTSTTIYVRLNGPTLNLSQSGNIVVSSTGATDTIVEVEGETLEYTTTTIGDVTQIDNDGIGTSIGDYVSLTGVLHCENFRNSGYDLTLIDDNNDGINLFNFDELDNYIPLEGDKLKVLGQIDQFNGLLQINPDSIIIITSGATLHTPTVVTTLDESTESQYIKLENLTLVNNETNWPDPGNIDVTNGVDTFLVRVPGASSLADTPTPNGPFHMIGVGKQFDLNSPFDSDYQIFPCSVDPICNVDVSTTLEADGITITANATGVDYQWIDCEDANNPIAGATNQSYTATTNGEYAVIITEGACEDTSACVVIDQVGLDFEEFAGVSVYPNPVNDELYVNNDNGLLQSVEVVSATGSVVYSSTVQSAHFTINTAHLNAGVYFVNVRTANSIKTFKVIK